MGQPKCESKLSFLSEAPILIFHRPRGADDDRKKHEYRSHRERRHAGYRGADGAAHREHASRAHQRSPENVARKIPEREETLKAEFLLHERVQETAQYHA